MSEYYENKFVKKSFFYSGNTKLRKQHKKYFSDIAGIV